MSDMQFKVLVTLLYWLLRGQFDKAKLLKDKVLDTQYVIEEEDLCE